MEMAYTLYSFDIVLDPGFSSATISRKKRIKNLFDF